MSSFVISKAGYFPRFHPSQNLLPKARTGPQIQDANNINAGEGALIVRSWTKLLHIFEETEQLSHFIYRELARIIFT